MYDVVGRTAPLLPADRPRYLMGTGMPDDLVESVARGIDMFDCVLPTRNARNGQLLTSARAAQHPQRALRRRPAPVDEACRCYTCRHFSRAYLRHLAWPARCSPRPSDRCITSSFTLTSWRVCGRLLNSGSFEEFRQNFHRTFSRQPLTR